MSLQLRFVSHSEVGLVRKNNQDSGYASPHLLVVADGMGGAAAGDLASAVAIDTIKGLDTGPASPSRPAGRRQTRRPAQETSTARRTPLRRPEQGAAGSSGCSPARRDPRGPTTGSPT